MSQETHHGLQISGSDSGTTDSAQGPKSDKGIPLPPPLETAPARTRGSDSGDTDTTGGSKSDKHV